MSKESLAILAGGLGKRAAEFTKGIHKSLIKLPDGLSIVERLLLQAKSHELERAYILTDRSLNVGVFEEILGIASRMNIEAISIDQDVSKFYGTMFALALVCSFVPKDENVFLFEGDVVISDTAATKIFATGPNTFIIDDVPKSDSESMKVVISDGKIKNFSKELIGYPEYCGIVHLDHKIRKKYNAVAIGMQTQNPYYEQVFNRLVDLGVELPYLSISESEWNEVDNYSDFIETSHKFISWKM